MIFKVGDKVRYTQKYNSFVIYNAVGVIVNMGIDGYNVKFSNDNLWFCVERNLVKIPSKNQQLLFNFMMP